MTVVHRVNTVLGYIVASMWTAAAAFCLCVGLYWLQFQKPPYDAPTATRIVSGPQVTREGVVIIERDLCIYQAGIPQTRHVRWHRVGDGNYAAAPVRVVTTDPGCRTVQVIYPVPDDIPLGRYRVHTSWLVHMNPLRNITVDGGWFEVEVVAR